MASITITVADADVPRVAAAIGDRMGLRDGSGQARSATPAEMRAFVVDHVRQLTRAYESNVATTAAAAAVTDVSAS